MNVNFRHAIANGLLFIAVGNNMAARTKADFTPNRHQDHRPVATKKVSTEPKAPQVIKPQPNRRLFHTFLLRSGRKRKYPLPPEEPSSDDKNRTTVL